MNTDEKILKTLDALRTDVASIKGDVSALKGDATSIKDIQLKHGKQIDRLVDLTAHLKTALKTLPTKKDVEAIVEETVEATVEAAKTELKADILMLESKVVKKIQSHERRITNIEDQEGIENPHKN